MKLFICLLAVLGLTSARTFQSLDFIDAEEGLASPNAACNINVNGGLQEPQPLIIKPDTEEWVFTTDQRGIIELEFGEQIEVFCTGGFERRPAVTNIILTCVDGTTFADDVGARNDFKFYNCKAYPYHDAVRSDRTCYNNATVLDVGFWVQERFLTVFEICWDEVLERTHYVTHWFGPQFIAHQSGFPRPNWYYNGYYNGKNPDNLMTRNNQRSTIAQILGSESKAWEYIPSTTDFFLARGHLAAKSDFIYGNHHRVTFWMMNIAPQWQVFNGFNWLEIEVGIKDFVASRNIVVDAYTGTFGTTTLKDEAGFGHEIYLAFDENNNGLIPVPGLFYKIIVDRDTQKGIVLVGVNNPYYTLSEILSDWVICEDVGDQVTWVKWNRKQINRGYSYACDVNDFFQTVKHHPDVVVNGLLI